MRFLLILLFATLPAGCGAYTQAQIGLVQQARRGLAMWSARESQRRTDIQRSFADRRDAIDQAFDADVLQRPELDPQWVIEHRKAYAMALDSAQRDRASALLATDAAADTARAADAALERLLWLISLRYETETLLMKGQNP